MPVKEKKPEIKEAEVVGEESLTSSGDPSEVMTATPPDDLETDHATSQETLPLPGSYAPKEQMRSSEALKNCYESMEVRQEGAIEGNGVFAVKDIPAHTILEEIPFIMWPRQNVQMADRIYKTLADGQLLSEKEQYYEHIRRVFAFKHPDKYYFKWYPPNAPQFKGEQVTYSVIPLGYGPIYNSHNTDNNAGWHIAERHFVFSATRDIKAGEEICTFYGYFISDAGQVFNTTDCFGMGLSSSPEDGKVYLKTIRFGSDHEKNTRMRETAFQQLNDLLGKSNRKLRIKRISVVENNVEKHIFDYPDNFSLDFHYQKLREFRSSRFQNIKLNLTWDDDKSNADIVLANHNNLL